MAEFSLSAIERLLKKSGCKRISVEACEELRDILEKKAVNVGKTACKLMIHAKRRTILKEDIKLANETEEK
ncbi:Archaeal histone HAN1 subunit A [Candidatus Tiddalikarchaeum anstoanum]|nr:Archaeal histone HAN1 subunit A [Candidatus Tiddalikarchaeum anstoanum]